MKLSLYISVVLCISFLPRTALTQCIDHLKACDQGLCINGTCVCNTGWTGALCDRCHGRVLLNESSGYVSDGPGNYSNLSRCSWLIRPTVRHSTLRLVFLEFATECGWDYLYVYDGDSAYSPLIATYNGLLTYKGRNTATQLIATSGSAFLQFSSDVAYSTTGFNISYSIGDCLHDCFNNGNCRNGTCSCNGNWSGSSCLCETCKQPKGSGANSCTGKQGVCQTKEKWSVVEIDSTFKKASYAISSVGETLWIYGGYTLNKPSVGGVENNLLTYNISTKQWKSSIHLNNDVLPYLRYGHSMVTWGDKLLVFGGTLRDSEKIVNELWEYDTKLNSWSQTVYNTSTNMTSSLLSLTGHTANLVKSKDGLDIMIVVFGYHPELTYSPFVFEYNPASRFWMRPSVTGYSRSGTYGHSSVYDATNNLLYIHGGYISTNPTRSSLTSSTFQYDPVSHHFVLLESSGFPKFLHSAVFLNGLMYVFGGSTHNDTNESKGALCYSAQSLAYDIACNKWKELPPPQLSLPIHRYGHKAVAVNNLVTGDPEVILFSGYDSQMLANMLIYYPEVCTTLNETQCEDAWHFGCHWNISHCFLLGMVERKHLCDKLESLTETGCNDSSCVVPPCSAYKNCFQCEVEPERCNWKEGLCQTGATDKSVCNITWTCEYQSTCEKCSATATCIWCTNLGQCIPSNSYVVQYPYGQCSEWTNKNGCNDLSCSTKKTCFSCQGDSRCGWCNDGSQTGLGTCLDGSFDGPLLKNETTLSYVNANQLCPSNEWHFVTCPKCQCNGHSTCSDDYKCINCTHQTTGTFCQTCQSGYFGNPLNGGSCVACQCGDKAVNCEPSSGKCYCATKGSVGKYCDECDRTNGYELDGVQNSSTCYYKLAENYQFTFTLQQEADMYITRINFRHVPYGEDDVELNIETEVPAIFNVSVVKSNIIEYAVSGSGYNFKYSFNGGNLSMPENSNTTILIHVSNLTAPCRIKVSILQKSNKLLHILLILFSSFLLILFFAAVTWRIKMAYDNYRLRITREVELKEMAARPFAGLNLLCDEIYKVPQENLQALQATETVCEEKCIQPQFSVVSVLLWLPTERSDKMGQKGKPPVDQPSFAFGSVVASQLSCKARVNPYKTCIDINGECFLQHPEVNLSYAPTQYSISKSTSCL